MSTFKKSLSFILAAVMLLSVFVIAPISASAEDLPPIKNLKIVEKYDNRIKLSWKREDYSFSVLYDDIDSDTWEWTSLGGDSTVERSFENLKYNKTYRFRICWVKQEYGETQYGPMSYVTYHVGKKNPIKVKAKTKSVKASALKKKKQIVKPFVVENAKGKVTYDIWTKNNKDKFFKKLSVNKKGQITIKKGKYKKGTYNFYISCFAKGNSSYTSRNVSKNVKIKIK